MDDLEGKMKHFNAEAKLTQSGAGISTARGLLGDELKLGYQRIRDALKED
jgi:hypothetical protein